MRSVHGRQTAEGQPLPAEVQVGFEALYRAFFVRLVWHATWRCRLSKEDACEVVQEAFMVALVLGHRRAHEFGVRRKWKSDLRERFAFDEARVRIGS